MSPGEQKRQRAAKLIQIGTQRLLGFVELLVDPRQLPSAHAAYDDLRLRQKLAYDLPWSHALLRALESQRIAARRCTTPASSLARSASRRAAPRVTCACWSARVRWCGAVATGSYHARAGRRHARRSGEELTRSSEDWVAYGLSHGGDCLPPDLSSFTDEPCAPAALPGVARVSLESGHHRRPCASDDRLDRGKAHGRQRLGMGSCAGSMT